MSDERSGLVMLALSTFRRSGAAVERALAAAQATRRLLVVNVADVNLARYFIGSDAIVHPHLRERCEHDLLAEHVQEGRERIAPILARARGIGIEAEGRVVVGRFAVEVLALVEEESPTLIVTTRSNRPDWVRRFFGSPVDQLVREAPCPVEVV